ncbi:glycine zipper 2TM domain-containing protein [Algiphilus sp.]|uniref:glycine zipper 2TM domain-containing protein n=1 Tax=Algiphilus sp. TaxID=1872431 RepID=UPI0032EF08CA
MNTVLHHLRSAFLCGALFSFALVAQAQVSAEVVDVQPIHTLAPSANAAECAEAYRPSPRDGRIARVLGGLAGGYVGNQFGGGSGQDLATIAGAIAGAEFAAARAGSTQRRCTVETRDRAQPERTVVGYDVIYRHAGRLWRTQTDTPPGETIVVPDRRAPR